MQLYRFLNSFQINDLVSSFFLGHESLRIEGGVILLLLKHFFFRFSLLIGIISHVLTNNRNGIRVSASSLHSSSSVNAARAKNKDMMRSHDDKK